MKSIEQYIWENSEKYSDKVAVKSGRDLITYGDLRSKIEASSEFFKSLDSYAPGKTVIIAAGKQIEFVYAYFGAHLANLVVAPIDFETNPTRFKYICNSIKPFCLVGFDKLESEIQKVSLKSFAEIDKVNANIKFPDIDSVADILFTTGTTGVPKGVPLTYRNEIAAALNINEYLCNLDSDVELLALPISHSFGLGRLRCCLVKGQSIHLLGSFVNVKRLFRTMEEEHITGFSMVPSSWKFLKKMSGNQLGNFANQLRYLEMGSAYFSVEDKIELANLLPKTKVAMHYGLTEASRSAFIEFHDDIDNISSVGKASPNTDIKIFDDNGDALGQGLEGEICVAGDHVTNGYLNISNENVFYDKKYFRTGDNGYIDSNGYIYLKARIKELINVGGKKVSPSEVEDQLLKIPGILECACVSCPDPDGILGEVVKAFIVKEIDVELTFEDISNMLVGKIESYKIPVFYSWIDSIPKTSSGKIQRNLLLSR